MNDKGVQVAIGKKRQRETTTVTEIPTPVQTKDQGTQCGMSKGSYGREKERGKWRYDDLAAKTQKCSVCESDMLVKCNDRSDGVKWECRRRIDQKRHKAEGFVRRGSWFAESKMTVEEILKFTCWWCQDLDQAQIRHEMGVATNT